MLLLQALWDLAVGRRCLACDTVGVPWCDQCLTAVWDVHHQTTPKGLRVTASARYEGEVSRAVLEYKERGHLALAVPLGRLLGAAMRETDAGSTTVSVVPVPSTRAATRARGHDHALRLARCAAGAIGGVVVPSLRWSRRVRDQSVLTVDQRRSNVAGAMRAKTPVRGGDSVVLIDDVMTTGATLDEGVRALVDAGWRPVGVAVVAAVGSRTALARRDRLR